MPPGVFGLRHWTPASAGVTVFFRGILQGALFQHELLLNVRALCKGIYAHSINHGYFRQQNNLDVYTPFS